MSKGWYFRPVLFVKDAEASYRHYVEALGFKGEWRHEEDGALLVGQVSRDHMEIILNRDTDRAGKGRVFLSVDDGVARKVTAVMHKSGADVRDGHWGMPVVIVRDLDGNELIFSDGELNKAT